MVSLVQIEAVYIQYEQLLLLLLKKVSRLDYPILYPTSSDTHTHTPT